ncbi:MAG TPA: alpha/beta hydrolase [Candidatus Saccharimonadales bacterium]|jgi:pimeloyl-ACP methyl ester carboxylesterase
MQVVVNSLLTQYERVGKGNSVLVLHGWGDTSKGWREFAGQLAPDYDVIVPDLPGFGGTAMPKDAWGLGEYAAFVGDFLGKIRVRPYAVIGHSNGGAMAIRGLANGDFQADKLVLIDSAGIRGEYLGRKKVLRIVTKTGKLFTTPLPHGIKKRLRRKVYETIGSDMLVVERLQETFKKVVTDDVQKDAAMLKLPTLLIYGEDDLDTPVQYGRIFHNLIDSSVLDVVPGAGHFAHHDKPDHVLEFIQEFLKA